MPKIIKKLVLIFLSTILFLNSMIMPVAIANAQIGSGQIDELSNLWIHKWYGETDPFAWYKKVYDPSIPESEIFGERYTAAQVQWVVYGIISMFLNLIPGNPDLMVYCTSGDVIKCGETIAKVVDGFNLITSVPEQDLSLATIIQNNPISGIGYVTRLVNKFTVVPNVSAQGFGYSTAANSFITLWQITRDISYGFMVIAIVVLSFMIMFQMKINPQTVISVQMAIPKIVSSLILITFSYAIAGFLVDLMYVFMGLLAMLLSNGGLSDMSAGELFTDMTTRNAFTLLYNYWVHFVGASFLAGLSGWGMGILVFIVSIISILVILWWSLKIIFMIVKNFALLVITIITGPLEIMLGTITQSTGFNTWIRKMITYLAFYPVLAIMFFLAFFFLQQGNDAAASFATNTPFQPAKNIIPDNSWEPPLSFLSVSGYRLIWLLVSFFIFSEITKVAEIVQGFISGKQWAYGSGISEVEKSVGDSVGKPALQAGAKYAGGWAKTAATAAGTAIKALVTGG